MAPPITIPLDDLIADVERTASDPLDKLAAAVGIADELGVAGDNLVSHFVDAARAVSLSWARIGSILGVSKQAAQQKFVPRGSLTVEGYLSTGVGTRLHQPGARTVLELANNQARRRGEPLIGTEHLLLGLLDEGKGLAATLLTTMGATPRGGEEQA